MPLRSRRRIVLSDAPELKRGDEVTVVLWNGSIIAAEVADPVIDNGRFLARTGERLIEIRLFYTDEGTTWARGREGEDVDALKAAEAMMPTRRNVPGTQSGRWGSKRTGR